MVSSAAPDSASWPKWMTCQSVMHPSWAEYWHIGAITMRLASSRAPNRRGVKSFARVIAASRDCGLGNASKGGLLAQTRYRGEEIKEWSARALVRLLHKLLDTM